jgi:hypothetical protein
LKIGLGTGIGTGIGLGTGVGLGTGIGIGIGQAFSRTTLALGDYVDPLQTEGRCSVQHMLIVGIELLKSVQASRYQVNRIARTQKNLCAKLEESLFECVFDRAIECEPCPHSRGLVSKDVRPHRLELRASETSLAKLAMKSSKHLDAANSRT